MVEQQNNRITTYIGMGLIFVLMLLWMKYAVPPQTTEQQTPPATTTENGPTNADPTAPAPATTPAPAPNDSAAMQQMASKFGPFAPAAVGTEQVLVLENELVRFEFTSKGGRIKSVLAKNYEKMNADSAGNDIKSPLRLFEDEKNRFDYTMSVNGAEGGKVNTSMLYFQPTLAGNVLTFRANASNGGYFEQVYVLQPNSYQLDYKVGVNNLQNVLSASELNLQVDNYLDKLEKNQTYERTMSSVYYRQAKEEETDYCDCRQNDQKALGAEPIKWFGHSNQFFNTSVVAKDFSFANFTGETQVFDNFNPDLKLVRTYATVPMPNLSGGYANMMIYSGPNEFKRLAAYDVYLEDIIPFGSSFLGTINRWVIHPAFTFLLKLIGSAGIVILVLTLLVKLILFPLTYKMVHGQAKMQALKPRLDELRKKFGDDQQQMSMESMKLYGEFGVNPLGGCMPMLLQMPIWLALYRFFPAAIEFRQKSFLWATDLSSYDVAFKLPFEVWGFGTHISLFTIIWVITTFWYTWYSMKQMDNNTMNGDQAKMMKYMQYSMPVVFMFFFNTFASGLTCYLCFSNLLNVGQTVFTKQFLIDHDKIKEQLEANRNKPKKQSGFRARLDAAMKEQQRLQEEQAKKKGGKK
jgi:YidC/Oxa1 family membrane protein insertase